MLVGLAATERRRVVGAGVAVTRLDEDKIRYRYVLFARRSIEIAVEQGPRPRISYGTEIAKLSVIADRFIRRQYSGCGGAFASAAVLVKANRHRSYNQTMKNILLTVVLTFTASAVFAQNASQVQKLFEAGQYQRVVESAQPDADPAVLYTAAQSHQKLGENDRAIETYGALASRDEGDIWHFIGMSGQQLVQDDTEGALTSARQAVEMDGGMAEAHYQLGLVYAKRQEWPQAAAEFDRVTEINPSNAYAHYYDGLMQYRANRPDRMANQFEQFLKLAPDAPERPEVMQIMKTVRGR
ncbi:MAG TPA: tetratricopeptide repeat protein [Vicinamibacterales bacterium]|nr:tetratricopeptide repeat protein [Vicinamibacterales bacterium]